MTVWAVVSVALPLAVLWLASAVMAPRARREVRRRLIAQAKAEEEQ